MTDWNDENGEPLGHWEPCTEADYLAVVYPTSPSQKRLTVFASRTDMGDRRAGKTFNQHIYTEWGERGSDTPLVSCEDVYDSWGERDHRHMRFIHADAS